MMIGDVVCISSISNTMMFGVCVCSYVYIIIYDVYVNMWYKPPNKMKCLKWKMMEI